MKEFMWQMVNTAEMAVTTMPLFMRAKAHAIKVPLDTAVN
jgi:hypothetical protein